MPTELIKTLADLAFALVSERRRHREANFEKHIEPCYNTAKLVFDDYLQYYNALKDQLNSDKTLEDILKYVRGRRLESLANRMEIRAILNNPNHPPLDPFDAAILVLVSGTQAVNHEFKHYIGEIADYLKFKNYIVYTECEFRANLLFKAQRQQRVIEQQFRTIALEYANYRNSVAERSRN